MKTVAVGAKTGAVAGVTATGAAGATATGAAFGRAAKAVTPPSSWATTRMRGAAALFFGRPALPQAKEAARPATAQADHAIDAEPWAGATTRFTTGEAACELARPRCATRGACPPT